MRGVHWLVAAVVAVAAALLLAAQGCDEEASLGPDAPASAVATNGDSGTPAAPKRARRSASSTEAGEEAAEEGADVGADDESAPGRISGRATDDAGTPLAGVTVRVYVRTGRRGGTSPVLDDQVDGDWFGAPVTTDADGRFETDFPPEGWHRVLFEKTGHASVVELCDAGRTNVDAKLRLLVPTEVLVTDEAGVPVAGAEIACAHDEIAPPYLRVRTDADGRATVGLAFPTRVAVRAAGFATEVIFVGNGNQVAEVLQPVVLVRGLPVAGVVVDRQDRPVPGAAVRLKRTSAQTEETTTDADGRFEFEGVAPTDEAGAILEIEAPGFANGSARAPPGDLDVRVVLLRTGTVSGVVVDAEGRPVANAQIGSLVFGDSGAFSLRLPEGPRTIGATAAWPGVPGALRQGVARVDVPAGGEVEGVRVVVGPGGRQSFVEVSWDGAERPPGTALSVSVEYDLTGAQRWASASLSAGASKIVPVPVPPGTTVSVTAIAPRDEVPGIAVAAGVETSATPPGPRIHLRLEPCPRVRVRVLDDSGERDDARDAVQDVEALKWCRRLADGTWAIRPDRAVVAGVRTGDALSGAVRLDPPHPPLREVEVRWVRGATVRGRFVDPEGTWRAADCTAALFRDGDGDPRSCDLGSDARFAFGDVAPGAATVALFDETGERMGSWNVEIAAAPATDLGDLLLVKGEWLEGRVADAEGRPLGGVSAALRDRDGVPVGNYTASAPDGTWRVRARPWPGLHVRFSKRGFATIDVPAMRGRGSAAVVLPRAGSVVVQILRPLRGGFVRCVFPVHGSGILEDVTLDKPGAWLSGVVADAAPGRMELHVRTGDGRTLSRTVEVVAGATVEAVFEE